MLVLPARVRVGVTSGGAAMADEETGMLVDTVRQEAHAIVGGGEAALADAARNVAMLRRFCAWNTLLILRARHGIPELVFGWAQWEAMGRFPVSADARIALLSPVRRPVTSGADGVRRHVPLPGPEPSDGRARWMRAEWVPVSAFDAPDTEGRPVESMFLTGDAPQRDTACEALAGMIRALGVAVLVEPGDPAGWAYNNYGFAVLGMTLELAADTSLDYVLAEGLLDPLGIDAAFEGGSVDNTDLLATLYYYGGSLARSTSEQRSYTLDYAPGHKGNFFDGGFTCSAGDLAKLAAVLANDGAYEGQVLLSPESVAWMETPLDTPVSDGRSTFLQCRPLRYQEELYGRDGLYYHTGSAYGQYALLSYDPDTGDGVVVLTSGADGVVDEHGIYAICGEIAQAVYAAVEEDT